MPKPSLPPGSIDKALKEFDTFAFTNIDEATFKLVAAQNGQPLTELATVSIADVNPKTTGNETVFDVLSTPGTEDFVINADLTQQLTHLADLF